MMGKPPGSFPALAGRSPWWNPLTGEASDPVSRAMVALEIPFSPLHTRILAPTPADVIAEVNAGCSRARVVELLLESLRAEARTRGRLEAMEVTHTLRGIAEAVAAERAHQSQQYTVRAANMFGAAQAGTLGPTQASALAAAQANALGAAQAGTLGPALSSYRSLLGGFTP